MTIYSCKGCVAPKRHPGCHDHCQLYLTEKSKYEQEKAEERKRKDMESSLNYQHSRSIYRAIKFRNQKG